MILFLILWVFSGMRFSKLKWWERDWFMGSLTVSGAGCFHQLECKSGSSLPMSPREAVTQASLWLWWMWSISITKGACAEVTAFPLIFPHSWATWLRSTIRSVAWPAVPTVPSTIPQRSSQLAGSSMLLQPWIFQDVILPFTEAWAFYLLSARRSTTPNGSMVSLPSLPLSHLICFWFLVIWYSKANYNTLNKNEFFIF